MTTSNVSRRAFIAGAAVAVSALAVGITPRQARAAGEALPHLSDKDPMAKALHYSDNATAVSKTQNPTYKLGDRCSKCRFFQGKPNEASGFASCQIYPGYSVSAKGWCASYSARA